MESAPTELTRLHRRLFFGGEFESYKISFGLAKWLRKNVSEV